MNERIRELAKEAVLSASATYAQGPDEIWLKEYNKKFAELIVRECTNRVNQYINDCGEVASLPDYVLESHFGVEK